MGAIPVRSVRLFGVLPEPEAGRAGIVTLAATSADRQSIAPLARRVEESNLR